MATLSQGSQDAGEGILSQGLALAAPEYLQADPARLTDYMEAERAARQNRIGAHGNTYQTPKSFRAGNPDPWAAPQPGQEGNSDAVFWDEPTPFQGLRPEIAERYIAIWQDPNSTPDDLLAYAKESGFHLDPDNVRKQYATRAKGAKPGDKVHYKQPPRVLTDLKDGATGAALRGFADPINMLDEMGGVVNAVVPSTDRENIWSSDRRFGDIVDNNVTQNRAVLDHDDMAHPYARFGGQLASGLIAPGASIEGVGLAAARNVLRAGGTRFAAEAAAKRAVTGRLATVGAVEGALAGAGQGEDWGERGTGALIGSAVGGALGVGLGTGAPVLGRYLGSKLRRGAGEMDADPAAHQFVNGASDTFDADVQNAATAPRNRDYLTLGERPVEQPPTPVEARAVAPVEREQIPVDDWGARTDAGRERYQRSIANLWQMPENDLVALHQRALEAERTQLRMALQKAGVAEDPRFGIGGDNMGRATERVGQAIERQLGEVPEDIDRLVSPRWEDHAEGGLPNADDIAEVLKGYSNAADIDDPHILASEAGWALRDLNPGDLEAVSAGQGSASTQRAVLTVRKAYEALARSGVTSAEMPNLIRDAMVRNGVPRSQADELTQSAMEMLKPAAQRASTVKLDAPAGSVGQSDAEPVLESASRIPDRIDVNASPRPLLDDVTTADRLTTAEQVDPADVLPLPSNTVDGVEEAERIAAGRLALVKAPNEADELSRRGIPSPRDATRTIPKRGPLDLVTWVRTEGGLREQRGELAHAGIDNTPRKLDFAGGEGRFGKLVRDDGLNYDEAALRAWEAGYFPDHAERPTVAEFLDALRSTHSGGNRSFRSEDLPEVDAFEQARRTRWDVESAREQGAPLVEDRGQPAGPDDLEANTPPVEVYAEWGENAPNLAGNIRLDKLDSPVAIKRALVASDKAVGGFDAATRGRITHAETESLASELGMTVEDLLKRRKGQALNAEQALASRQILARSATEMVRLARKAVGGSDADKTAFRQAWVRHVAIQEQVSGATAEAGRALQQFRMTAESKAAAGRIHKLLIDEAGGAERLEETAQAILDLEKVGTTPGGIAKFAQRALKPRFRDKLVELYYNALLWSPATHAVNVLSNTLTSALQIPEHAAAAGLGAFLRTASLRRLAHDRVMLSEVGGRAVGLLQGAQEGLRAFAHTARTGIVPDHVTKVEAQEQHAISGLKGSIIRTPTRMLSAEDEFFKAAARRMEVTGLAMRKARMEGLKGDAYSRRVAALTANPTDDMVERSMDYARYLTFQRPLGKFGNLLSTMTKEMPALKLVVPFVRTPTNILKFAAERSPAAPLLKEWRADFVAGGARRDLAVARMTMGTGLGMMAAQWAEDGHITGGGPADKGAKAPMLADGWQPYSVKIGDRYVSYQRFDPLATTLGVAADFVDNQKHMTESQRDKAALNVTVAIMKNLSNKVWLSGISDLGQAIGDPGRYGEGFIARIAGSVAVPAVVGQTARAIDPVMRDARGPMDRITSRIPFASRSLEPRRDVWGEVITSEGSIGPDIASPIRTSTARNDPITAELLAIEASIGKVPRKVGGRELTPAESGRYQELAGQYLRADLEAAMGDSEWRELDAEDRKDAVSRIKESTRKDARSALGL